MISVVSQDGVAHPNGAFFARLGCGFCVLWFGRSCLTTLIKTFKKTQGSRGIRAKQKPRSCEQGFVFFRIHLGGSVLGLRTGDARQILL